MKPGKVNLTIYKGTTFVKSFQWKTGDPLTPVDLTGFKIRAQFRSKQSSPDVLEEFTSTNSKIVITSLLEGKFMMTLDAATTSLIEYKSAVYDLEVEDASGKVIRLIEGAVTIVPEVTR